MPPNAALHCNEAVSKFRNYMRIRDAREPEKSVSHDLIFIQHVRVCNQYDRLQQHGYHALLSVCVQTCLLITILGLAHGKSGRHGRRMALGGRAGHLPSRFKEHSTSSGRRARSSPLGNDDDNWALVSDDSSLLGVAGMVGEWLSLGERLGFQSVYRIISFQLKLQLARGVLDSLDEDKWTSLGNEWERYCYEAQESAVVFPHDVRKSLRLIWGSALSFRTIACASKRVAVIFAHCDPNTSRNRTLIKYRLLQWQTISRLSQTRASSLMQ